MWEGREKTEEGAKLLRVKRVEGQGVAMPGGVVCVCVCVCV